MFECDGVVLDCQDLVGFGRGHKCAVGDQWL